MCRLPLQDFRVAGARLARLLRAPPHSVDLVVALTHMRQPNDEALARDGSIDLILAGHDHHYGVTENNSCKIFKSGTDFETFSTVTVTFPARAPAASPRKTTTVAVTSVGMPPSAPEGGTAVRYDPGGGSGEPQSPLEAALDAGLEREEDGSQQPPRGAYVSAYARVDVTPAAFGDGDAALAAELAPFEARVNAMLGAQLCVSAVELDSRREAIRLGEVRRGGTMRRGVGWLSLVFRYRALFSSTLSRTTYELRRL